MLLDYYYDYGDSDDNYGHDDSGELHIIITNKSIFLSI